MIVNIYKDYWLSGYTTGKDYSGEGLGYDAVPE